VFVTPFEAIFITVTVFHNFLEPNRHFKFEMDSDTDVLRFDVLRRFIGSTLSLTSIHRYCTHIAAVVYVRKSEDTHLKWYCFCAEILIVAGVGKFLKNLGVISKF